MTTPEAGEVVALNGERIGLEILPRVGARIHRLRFDGHDVLRTPSDLTRHFDDPWFWGSYPMAPWCNRLRPGRTELAGRTVDLRANFPDGTAIHGQVDQAAWERAGDGSFRIRAGGDDAWPWPYAVEQVFAIDGSHLVYALRLTNLADEPMPAGIGIHPWFAKPLEVRFQAAATYPDNLATEPHPIAVSGAFDRRRLERMPDDLDATWTDLGEPPIELAWPGAGIRCAITFEAPNRVVTAASPVALDGVAIEPATQAPDGIRRLLRDEGDGLTLLPAGAVLELQVRFAFTAQT